MRLIETQASSNWSTYTLNDEVNLFIAHSRAPRPYHRDGGGLSWQFVFSANQMRQIGSPDNGKPVWLALVCVAESESEVCLVSPEEAAKVIEVGAPEENLTVRKPDGRSQFRVMKGYHEAFKVPRSRIENWDVPGS